MKDISIESINRVGHDIRPMFHQVASNYHFREVLAVTDGVIGDS